MDILRKQNINNDIEIKHSDGLANDRMMNRKQEGTFCQIARDIFHLTENEEIKLKCRMMIRAAKRVDKQLKLYKKRQDYND